MQPKPDIQRIQGRQSALLRVLDQLCQTHHITYFLAYGSLLGAVRHQGPIPWDDDLDILVPRADWLRLQALCQEHLSDLCMVQTPWTDPAYRKPYVPFKLRDRFSSFVEEDAKYWQGNYIDIFPLDLLKPEQLPSWDAMKKRASRLSSLYLSKNRKDPSLSPLRRNLRYLLQCVAGLVHPRHLLRWTDAKVRMFQGLPATGLPDAFDVSAALSLNKRGGGQMAVGLEMIELDRFPVEAIFPLKTTPYAGLELPIPNQPDVLLRHWYGDYWKIPPENLRPVHCQSYEEQPWPPQWAAFLEENI